jgi:hypothetical protein
MALVEERQSTSKDVAEPPRVLAYDLVQGALVKWRWKDDKSVPDTPTAVLLHGILGSGKNWGQCCVVPCKLLQVWLILNFFNIIKGTMKPVKSFLNLFMCLLVASKKIIDLFESLNCSKGIVNAFSVFLVLFLFCSNFTV